jgi:Glyoxalase-like domain
VLGWGVSSEGPGVTNVEPAGFAYPDPVAVCIDVIAVPESKTVKNRVHLDLATTSAAHQADLVARLQDLGATPADVGQGDVSWTVMADPEGNEFCVLTRAGPGPSAVALLPVGLRERWTGVTSRPLDDHRV